MRFGEPHVLKGAMERAYLFLLVSLVVTRLLVTKRDQDSVGGLNLAPPPSSRNSQTILVDKILHKASGPLRCEPDVRG